MSLYDIKGNVIATGGSSETSLKKVPWDTVIHRGWISGAKENTIPALFLVKEKGYDWGECDIRFSSDGVPVLAHDATIKSEDGNTVLTVDSSTVEELQSIVLQTHERFGEIKLATLKELMDVARIIDLGLVLDIKVSGTEQNLKDLASIVVGSGFARKVIYMPTSISGAKHIQSIDKNASFDFVSNPNTATDFTQYQELLTGSNTVAFDMQASTTDANGGVDMEVVNAIHSAGLNVSFWNIRTSSYLSYMDAGPIRITKQNTADAVDLDSAYLNTKTLW